MPQNKNCYYILHWYFWLQLVKELSGRRSWCIPYLHWWQMLPQLKWTCSFFYTYLFLPMYIFIKKKKVLFLYVLCNCCFSVSSLSIKFLDGVNHLFIYSAQNSVMPSKWFMIHYIPGSSDDVCNQKKKKTDNRNQLILSVFFQKLFFMDVTYFKPRKRNQVFVMF